MRCQVLESTESIDRASLTFITSKSLAHLDTYLDLFGMVQFTKIFWLNLSADRVANSFDFQKIAIT